MKAIIFRLLRSGAAIAAAGAARNLASSVWRGDHEPPIDPGDADVSWREAAAWAALSGLLARRGTEAGWKKATGEPAPV